MLLKSASTSNAHGVSLSSASAPLIKASQSSETSAAGAHVHHFDVLHPILVSHLRRANSVAVMTLLGLPEIAQSALFWQTCTYREGLVAALLQHVMEATGQREVTSTYPAHNSETVMTNAHDERSSEATHTSGAMTSLPTALPRETAAREVPLLTPCDLYTLLYRCVHAEQAELPLFVNARAAADESERTSEGPLGERSAPVASAYKVALDALLRRWPLPPNRRKVSTRTRVADDEGFVTSAQDDRDLQLYLTSVLHTLERMLKRVAPQRTVTEAKQSPAKSASGTASSPNRKRDREGDREGEEEGEKAEGEALQVDLDALVAVLLEHFSDFTYTNPFPATAAEETSASFVPENTNAPPVTTRPAESSPSPPAAPAAPSSLKTRAAAPASTSAPTAAPSSAAPPAGGAHDTPVGVATDAQEVGSADTEGTDVDAVALLQRLPAISATRWAIPPPPPTPPKKNNNSAEGDTAPTREMHSAHVQTATASLKASKAFAQGRAEMESFARPQEVMSAPSQQQQQQQRDAEEARVSAAIQAFDAFTASLGQPQQQQQHQQPLRQAQSAQLLSSDRPIPHGERERAAEFTEAQRHRNSESAAATAARGTKRETSSTPTPPTGMHQRAPPPPPSPLRRVEAPATSSDNSTTTTTNNSNHHSTPAAPRTSATRDGRVIRRRFKFSEKEDAAIVHGVAQFGQGPSAFQYIFHAHRAVWLAGRTPTHLYDHWRGALRRRAVAAVSEEFALANAREVRADGEEGDRANPAWAEQDVAADIEDSSSVEASDEER